MLRCRILRNFSWKIRKTSNEGEIVLEENTPLTELPGIGPARAKILDGLEIRTAKDLLNHFPRRYEDRRQCWSICQAPPGQMCCVSAMVAETPRSDRIRSGLELVKVKTVDSTGVLWLTFFNQGYVRNALLPGEKYVFYGRVEEQDRAVRSMVNPVFEPEAERKLTGRIMPVYPLAAGISNNLLSGWTRRLVEGGLDWVSETVPESVRLEHHLCGAEYAYRNLHYPSDFEALEQARRRMAFEELLVLTCGMALRKERRRRENGRVLPADPEQFRTLLPFSPTEAQWKAIREIAGDLSSGKCMDRLIQGDVGSGKTAVAAFAVWAAARNGCQSALMAPTSLLAEQHAETLRHLLSPAGVRVGLLTGSIKEKERRAQLTALRQGETDLMVGTHALFSEDVEYYNLNLVIVDEQHRFGVAQRESLLARGEQGRPHALVMSATPIPRTLALTIYGDLDVSVMDELPPGRSPVKTYVISEKLRSRMYQFIRRQAEEGHQTYIVCPAVEETEENPEEEKSGQEKSVKAFSAELQEKVFPDLRVGLIHGKMGPEEKEKVMAGFAAGMLDVLVATTVIEVGVDVANATLMVIENAERFGLSQLHQLRGRVGRGRDQSYCVLMTSGKSETALKRLRVFCQENDGFRIAEEDLRLRGPGEFFGRRQHGLPPLKTEGIPLDAALLQETRETAEKLIREDPELSRLENQGLRQRVDEMYREGSERFS